MTEPTRTLLLELRHPGRLGAVETTELRDGEEGFDFIMRELGWVRIADLQARVDGKVLRGDEAVDALGLSGSPSPRQPFGTVVCETAQQLVEAFGETNGHPVKVGETAAGEEVHGIVPARMLRAEMPVPAPGANDLFTIRLDPELSDEENAEYAEEQLQKQGLGSARVTVTSPSPRPTLSALIAARINGGGNGFGTIGARLDALIEVLEEERAR